MPASAVFTQRFHSGQSRLIMHEYSFLGVSTNKDASPKQDQLNPAETPSEPC
ncbi:hypothetical protein B0H11DRAFT_2216863 [Mycena galericulata]|nr:hypothetical protein B0H11DRAFT_2216863 [Mycena galericulata]